MTTIQIVPDGPFSLTAAAGFGFGPNTGRPTPSGATMKLAFATDDFTSHAFVDLDQADDGVVTANITSDVDVAAVERQVRRILSLDASGTEWGKVGERDPVLGGLQERHPGLRPVLFHSPYEAAAWSIISARRQRAQGTAVRARIAEAFGRRYGDGADARFAFPTPSKILELRVIQGLELVKVERLHQVARAALDGDLQPELLLGMDSADALAHLQKLPGIGPLYSTLILMRSTGATNTMTGLEPRLPRYLAHFYGLSADIATDAEISAITDGWAPFRTWSSVLVRAAGEYAGIPLPEVVRAPRRRA